MQPVVSLKRVVGELDICPSEAQSFLNLETGECWIASYEELSAVEEEEDEQEPDDTTPDWQRQSLAKLREILDSKAWIELPTGEFNDYDTMRDFCESLDSPTLQQEFLSAIRGSGAFRRFKQALRRHDLEPRWYAFHDEALTAFARNWLDAHGIPHKP